MNVSVFLFGVSVLTFGDPLVDVLLDQLNLLGDFGALLWVPLIEVVKRSLNDSLQVSQSVLLHIVSANDFPKENSVVESKSQLNRINLVLLVLVIGIRDFVSQLLRDESRLLVVLPGLLLIDNLQLEVRIVDQIL